MLLSWLLLKSLLTNIWCITWHLIGWQHSRQPIKSHVREWPSTFTIPTNALTCTAVRGSLLILGRKCLLEYIYHDDVIKWKHFLCYWPFVRGIHRSPVNSPHKGQWRGALIFSLICVWINGWVNNSEASDLRRYRAHYDVTIMIMDCLRGILVCIGSNLVRSSWNSQQTEMLMMILQNRNPPIST